MNNPSDDQSNGDDNSQFGSKAAALQKEIIELLAENNNEQC